VISATTGVCLAFIVLTTGIAIAAGPNLALAVPAGAAAVVLAMFLGLYSSASLRSLERRPHRAPEIRPSFRIHRGLVGDPIHREEVLLLLDRVERAGPNPRLPSRTRSELVRIMSMETPEFRRYVATRLDQLERES